MEGAQRNFKEVQGLVSRAKRENRERLESEYQKLVQGLALAGMGDADMLQVVAGNY